MLWSLSHIDTNKHRSPNPFSCLRWLLIILQTISESYCVADSAVFQMGKRMAFARTAPFLVEKQSPEKTRIQCSHCLWPTALPWPHNKPPNPAACSAVDHGLAGLHWAWLGLAPGCRSGPSPLHTIPILLGPAAGQAILFSVTDHSTRREASRVSTLQSLLSGISHSHPIH